MLFFSTPVCMFENLHYRIQKKKKNESGGGRGLEVLGQSGLCDETMSQKNESRKIDM